MLSSVVKFLIRKKKGFSVESMGKKLLSFKSLILKVGMDIYITIR